MILPRLPDSGPSGTGSSLLRLLPPVLRARDFRLYTQGRGQEGDRLVDLWQNGGGAILGHKAPSVLREFKNAANRGLLSPLPHPLEKRLQKALARLFPRRIFRVYAPGTSPAGLWEAAGLPLPRHIADPAIEPCPAGSLSCGAAARLRPDSHIPEAEAYSERRACDTSLGGSPCRAAGSPPSLWRPFLNETAPLAVPEEIPAVIPLLPGAGWLRDRPIGPLILAFDPAAQFRLTASGGANPGETADCPFPPSDLIPPVLLAALTRGIYDLIAAAPERGICPFPKIRSALDTGPWERRGIYLSLRDSPAPAAWEDIFRRFLTGGFLIPPDPEAPLILPGALSPGEEAKLAELLAEPGN